MGNMIGILSTVILVSTLATLIFAVGAYVMARRRRISNEDEDGEDNEIPEQTEPLRQAPESTQAELPPPPPVPAKPAPVPAKPAPSAPIASEPRDPITPVPDGVSSARSPAPPVKHVPVADKEQKTVFRRLTSQGDQPVDFTEPDKKPGWDWE